MEQPNTNALATIDKDVLVQLGAISPMIMVEQVKLVQTIMSSVMREDEHFGVIPGTKKKSLYKSGAEKLCFTFQLVPEFDLDERNLPNGHREFVVTCHLVNRAGQRVGTGVGSCSTMESKYRYRGNELIPTGEEVPKAYWDTKRTNPSKASEMIGKGRATKKDEDGIWRIYEKGEKGENPDIADMLNTVLKMAKKRAHVDATITSTACSDIFTQDVEDLPQYAGKMVEDATVVTEPTISAATTQPSQAEPPRATDPPRRTPVQRQATSQPAAQPAQQVPANAPVEAEFTMVSPEVPAFVPPEDLAAQRNLFGGWKLKLHKVSPADAKAYADDLNAAGQDNNLRKALLVKMHADLTAQGII